MIDELVTGEWVVRKGRTMMMWWRKVATVVKGGEKKKTADLCPTTGKGTIRNQPRRTREDMNQPRPLPPRWQHNPKFPRQNEQELTGMLLPPSVQIFVVITGGLCFWEYQQQSFVHILSIVYQHQWYDCWAKKFITIFPHRLPYHTRSATAQGEKNKEKETPGMSSKEPHRLQGQPSNTPASTLP